MPAQSRSQSFFIWTGFAVALFSVVVQLYLQAVGGGLSFFNTLANFLSYFTILTNLLALVCYAALLFGHDGQVSAFFERPVTQTAIMVNMVIVGLIYNVVLRQLWAPSGIQRLVDEMLHAFNPFWFLLLWLLFTPKRRIRLAPLLVWLAYPAAYLVYTLLRGMYTGWYPYPFVNVAELGLQKVLLNSLGITGLFVVFLLLAVGLARAFTAGKKGRI
ncbi:hypothetical protein C7T94_03370 [Pedobacter yulinensis]|uniref:Pr6Pr family membrane protein n=1 Tax=Pedobacter yulinensis TaxID=2126353 RepID=A0A2T3HRU2_9SPHI|nr:Pr6Pr family membrane protein [Pedobacter yulinensis]PST85158.1 hypothetical protein C7T94_03370 [Pedobacter yulinensis]